MKCPQCEQEFDTSNFPAKCKSLTIVCHSCGLQMEVEKRPVVGWKWPKVAAREDWVSPKVTSREKVGEPTNADV